MIIILLNYFIFLLYLKYVKKYKSTFEFFSTIIFIILIKIIYTMNQILVKEISKALNEEILEESLNYIDIIALNSYIIAKSNIKSIFSHVMLIDKFISSNLYFSKTGYYFLAFKTSISNILDL